MTALTQTAKTVIGRAALVGRIIIAAFAGPIIAATKEGWWWKGGERWVPGGWWKWLVKDGRDAAWWWEHD